MAWVPPHKRPGYVPPAPKVTVQTRMIKFPTNALNAGPEVTNVIESAARHSPSKTRKNAYRGALKKTTAVAANSAPPAIPTFKLSKLPTKYKKYLLEKGIRGPNISKDGKKTRRHRTHRHKKPRHTRRHKK